MSTMELTREIRDKRIAIAKDVIARLDAGKLTLEAGWYMNGWLSKPVKDRGDLRDRVDEFEEKCKVCMLGAALLSKARLYDNVPTSSLNNTDIPKRVVVNRPMVVGLLEEVFDLSTLDLMESVFECDTSGYTADYKFRVAAQILGESLENEDARARAVCQILIKNDGEFILPTAEARP